MNLFEYQYKYFFKGPDVASYVVGFEKKAETRYQSGSVGVTCAPQRQPGASSGILPMNEYRMLCACLCIWSPRTGYNTSQEPKPQFYMAQFPSLCGISTDRNVHLIVICCTTNTTRQSPLPKDVRQLCSTTTRTSSPTQRLALRMLLRPTQDPCLVLTTRRQGNGSSSTPSSEENTHLQTRDEVSKAKRSVLLAAHLIELP